MVSTLSVKLTWYNTILNMSRLTVSLLGYQKVDEETRSQNIILSRIIKRSQRFLRQWLGKNRKKIFL